MFYVSIIVIAVLYLIFSEDEGGKKSVRGKLIQSIIRFLFR